MISKPSPRRRSATAPERRQTCRSTTSAAQAAGASRALSTTAARRQSSSKASIVLAMATSEPSRSRPMQPAWSHRMPSASVWSLGVRASASAASHSRSAKMSLPDLTMASRPSAPRTAKALPSAATSTSGCGARDHQDDGAADQERADEPQRRLEQAEHHEAQRSPSSSGPVPNAAMRPDALRESSRPRARPRSSSRCPGPSAASRSRRGRTAWRRRRECPHGITQTDTTGIASRFATTP